MSGIARLRERPRGNIKHCESGKDLASLCAQSRGPKESRNLRNVETIE